MTEEGGFYMSKLLIGLSVVVAGAMLLRAVGRLSNPAYTQVSGKPFLEILRRTIFANDPVCKWADS